MSLPLIYTGRTPSNNLALPGTTPAQPLTLPPARHEPPQSEDMNGVALKWFTSRQPERYSSAAPMSADARQRIVFELVDFSEPLIMTVRHEPRRACLNCHGRGPQCLRAALRHHMRVRCRCGPPPLKLAGVRVGVMNPQVSVGPVPPGLDGEPSSWSAEEVADAVLKDKSTGRVTNGQRVALSSVEEARTETRGGVAYYVYEHVSQGSPNMNVRGAPPALRLPERG